jgi:hypothetical protein
MIIKNRDEKGNILTYSVDVGYMLMEFNTLKEARLIEKVIKIK